MRAKQNKIFVWLYIIPSTEQNIKKSFLSGSAISSLFTIGKSLDSVSWNCGQSQRRVDGSTQTSLSRRSLSVSKESCLRDRRGEREGKENRETDGLKDDLPRSRFNSEDGERREEGRGGSGHGEGREDQCADNNGGLGDGSGEINNIPWQIHSGRLWKCINLQN